MLGDWPIQSKTGTVQLLIRVSQVAGLESEVTSVTGGLASLFVAIPTIYLFVLVAVAVQVLVGFVGMFTRRW